MFHVKHKEAVATDVTIRSAATPIVDRSLPALLENRKAMLALHTLPHRGRSRKNALRTLDGDPITGDLARHSSQIHPRLASRQHECRLLCKK